MAKIPTDGSIKVSIPNNQKQFVFDKQSGSMTLSDDLLNSRKRADEDWFREQE